jgi:triacylglycerol lipase
MSLLTTLPFERYDGKAFDGFAAGSNFSLGNAKSLIWLSQAAYETDDKSDKITKILGLWGLRLATKGILSAVLPIASTKGFVAAGPGATFVAFAGTDPVVLANLITDFDIPIKDATQTAQGFQTAADAVWDQVLTAIGDPALSGNKIYVTGHSLGGALAALTAQRIADKNLSVEAVYTFGMPRAGSPEFAARYNNSVLGPRTYRLVYADDIVPTVAPSGLGFHHVGCYLPCQLDGPFEPGRFIPVDPSKLTAAVSSDEPSFVAGVSKDLQDLLQQPLAEAEAPLARLKLVLGLAEGRGPAGMRTDIGGILIELLPPRLRNHMPDRYIGAL